MGLTRGAGVRCATISAATGHHLPVGLREGGPAEGRTLSGFSRSSMAVPSARNSGLLRISKCTLGSAQFLLSTCTQQCIQHLTHTFMQIESLSPVNPFHY